MLQALAGHTVSPPPIWFMRQAGRYLPEYRAVRAEAGSFLDLCYNPARAAEVTLQPIRRFGLDAAILFSDILVVPHALGVNVWFEEGEGPRLDPCFTPAGFAALARMSALSRLEAPCETVSLVRRALPPKVAVIGFAGAPFTVATYMLAGRSVRDPAALRRFAYDEPGAMRDLIALLEEVTARYLIAQAHAGADVVQIFDSWAGGLPEALFEEFCVGPVVRIAARVKEEAGVPVIAFPRGAGCLYPRLAGHPAVSGISIDTSVPWKWAAETLSPLATVQGGLDPLLVVAGGAGLDHAVEGLCAAMADRPFIFNLGHGFVPETPIAHVEQVIRRVRGGH